MYTGPGRVIDFDPSILLNKIELSTNHEILIKRQISAMYMAVFNFWSAIEFYHNGRIGNGRSNEHDDFQELAFDTAMLKENVTREIMTLSIFRNACDHRLENPTKNIKFTNNTQQQPSVPVNNNTLRKAYESFTALITVLKTKYNIP
ncbi:MAG: hypothetical protein ACYCSG_03130 [Thermoplasmataceae archaeon]